MLLYVVTMKVLFVCKGNMVRSVLAEKFFNSIAPKGYHAQSAGTVPGTIPDEPENVPLKDIPYLDTTITVADEMGFDISEDRTRRVTPKMVDYADLIINMAEEETVPVFLKNSPKVTEWLVPNPNRSKQSIIDTRDRIIPLVQQLVKDLSL